MILIHLVVVFAVLLLLWVLLHWIISVTGAPPVLNMIIDIMLVLILAVELLQFTIGLAGLGSLRMR